VQARFAHRSPAPAAIMTPVMELATPGPFAWHL